MNISIYLTNLGKYNEGYLLGEWLNLAKMSEEDLQAAIKRIVTDHGNEEWFITDYEAPFKIEEYSDIFKLREVAEELANLEDCQVAGFLALLDCGYEMDEAVQKAEDVIVYEADSERALGYELVEQGYINIPEEIEPYFDYEAYGADWAINMTEEDYNDKHYFVDTQSV